VQGNYLVGTSRAVARLWILPSFTESTDQQIPQTDFASTVIEKCHQAVSVEDILRRIVVVASTEFSLEMVLTINYASCGIKINYKLFI
jgi:hypothetical protein